MNFMDVLQHRRSIRQYTGEKISEETLQHILQAGMLSASSRSIRPWEFVVVQDQEMLHKMSECREGAAKMLAGAAAAIVVLADSGRSDVWIEDCSIVMSNMHLMADALGLGSCWIQGRLRNAANGQTTEEYLRDLLKFPDHFSLEAILSLGMPAVHPAKRELSDLPTGKVHYEKYGDK